MSGQFTVRTDDGLTGYDMIYKIVGADAVAGHYLTSAVDALGLDGVARILTEEHGADAVRLAFGFDGGEVQPDGERWRLPVGEGEYPAAAWYVASVHNPGVHIGIDVNLDRHERGDVERRLGLHVFAMADGVVEYVGEDWDVATDWVVVVRHVWKGVTYYVRYAHLAETLVPLRVGATVDAGYLLGAFADWGDGSGQGKEKGDHLHLDIAMSNQKARYSVNGVTGIEFVDPAPLLRDACGAEEYDAMARKGD